MFGKTTMGKEHNREQTNLRTLVVLDTENLVISCKIEQGRAPRWKELNAWIHDNYQVIDKLAYLSILRQNSNRDYLEFLGWTLCNVVSKKKKKGSDKEELIPNALDAQLIVGTIDYRISSDIDHILLISGDGDYLPMVHDDDDICGDDGTEAVRDYEGGAIVHYFLKGPMYLCLAVGIDLAGGLIEDEDCRVLEDGAGDDDSLKLSAAQAGSLLADDGVVAFREQFDELMCK